MKAAVRSKIEFLLFLCILVFSVAMLRPLMQTLEKKLTAVRSALLTELEQTYNIRLSYESLSPSILRSISLRNVKVYDAEHNIEIASFEDFSIQYRFWALLWGNTIEILDSVNIANGFIDIDLVQNTALAQKLNTTMQTSASARSSVNQSSANTEELLSFLSSQMLNVYVKNVRVRFRNAVHDVDAKITEGYFGMDSEALTVSLSTSAFYRNADYTAIGQAETGFTLEGKFNKNLTAGSAVADFSHISTDRLGIYRVKLFVDYRDKVFTFNTMQDFQPVDFTASWNIATNDINGMFSCKDFAPLQSVRVYNAPTSLTQFASATMSGSVQFALSGQHIQWNTDLSFALPSLLFSSYRFASSRLQLAAEGKDSEINVSRLSLSGADADIFSEFTLNFNTMLPTGTVAIKRLTLPSGASAAAELRFFKQGKTFFCKIPKLTAGEGSLRNITLAVNPSAQKADYTFSAEDNYGKYGFDGSYIYNAGSSTSSPHFVELHGAFDAVSIGTICNFIQAAIPKINIPQAAVESLQCTTEFYISSDLRSFSYNCIRFVLVSNAVNDFYALVSAKGNQSSFALTDIELFYKNMSVRGNINADFDRLSDIIFTSSLAINSIGYQIRGVFSQNVLTIYGDYGLAISALYEKGTGFQGTVKTKEMPLPFLPLFLTIDSEFYYHNSSDWLYTIDSGALTYGAAASLARAIGGLKFRGKADRTGLFLSEVKLGDDKALTGTLAVTAAATADSGSEKNYTAAMHLASPDAAEKIEFGATLALSDGAVCADGALKLDSVSLARFLYTQGETHTVSADAAFSVAPDALSVQLNVSQLAMFVQGENLNLNGSLMVENEKAKLNITQLVWGAHTVAGITGDFSLDEMTGKLNADYAGTLANKQLRAHISTVYTGVQPEEKAKSTLFSRLKSVTERFTVNTSLSDWQFGDFSGKDAVPLSMIRDPGVTAFYAGKNDDITGFILDDGVVSLQLAESLPLKLNLDGTIKKDALNLTVSGIRADIKKIWDITGLDYVLFYGGTLTGDLTIGGKPMEPEFNGKLVGQNISVNSPRYAPEIYGPVALDIIAEGTGLEVPYTVLKGPSTEIWARCTAEFSGWIPDDISVQCGTLGTKMGVFKTDNILFKADGFAGCTVEIKVTPTLIGVYGSATFDSGYFVFKFNDLDKFKAEYGGGDGGRAFDMKLDVQFGHKAEFRWPTADFPILRTLIPTESPLLLIVDAATGDFSMTGDIKMRGGDVFYIKRSFYIREGSITFANTAGEIDPLVTLRAEIRDRDSNGEPFRLVLTAKDQSLFSFNPDISSDPPRSTDEIMQLLGQVAIGDTSNDNVWQNLLVTGSDILAQVGFLKKAESKVRDFLKLDAFSFRTLLLQNAIFGNLFSINQNTTLTLSNYLDNTSVYIGKYFGSAIYADALLHLSHYDSKLLKNGGSKRPVYKDILFQPEIGLEMATPFFLLRWSVAPTKPDTLFVGDTALTFSWKYSY